MSSTSIQAAANGAALTSTVSFLADWRNNGQRHIAGHGQARRTLYCGGHQLHRQRHALWASLGLHRGSPFLHFEVCYHQAIDFAIDRKLRVVEAGAQGEHKLARGYVPVTTHSAHYIAHEGFRRAVSDYLEHERREVEQIHVALEEHSPFRHT